MQTKKMLTLAELENLPIGITIGNFDGVHLGHQRILQNIKKKCEKEGLAFVVITFTPHPLVILKNQKNFLISSYGERRKRIQSTGADFIHELEFTRDFSTLLPEDFLAKYILKTGKVQKIFLGYDFAFGANKSGDHNFVKKYCEEQRSEIEVIVLDEFKQAEKIVSSSLVRKTILAGNLEEAAGYLGRNFQLCGRVIKGEGRGKMIGFPTANIEIPRERILPPFGVYATLVEYKGGRYLSLTNIGNNPTFKNDNEINFETHLLDFDEDIYGEEINIFFIKKIRDEVKFESVNDLITQIGKDVLKRREIG
jgi:riboflavin kinase / FMN adenylyltransferase